MTTALDFLTWTYHVIKGMPVLAVVVLLIGWAAWVALTSGEVRQS